MNKHELTEKLKVIETEIYNDKVDLNSINVKLENAYKYEEELLKRLDFARKQTEDLRNQFFIKSTSIIKKFNQMKSDLDIWTGFILTK